MGASTLTACLVGLFVQVNVGASAVAGPPKPSDVLLIMDTSSDATFDTAVNIVQTLDLLPRSRLTVVSTDREQLLVDGNSMSEIDRSRLSHSSVKPLTLNRLKTLTSGHFNNQDKTHNATQIVIILSDQSMLPGDLSLVQAIRKKKITVVAVGKRTEELSPVFPALAADDRHVLGILNPSEVDNLIKKLKILISQDSKMPCDTDTWKLAGDQYCSDECKNVCYSTQALEAKFCKDVCPFYHVVNTSALEIVPRRGITSKDTGEGTSIAIITVGVTVGVIVGIVVITVLILLYFKNAWFNEKKRLLATRLKHCSHDDSTTGDSGDSIQDEIESAPNQEREDERGGATGDVHEQQPEQQPEREPLLRKCRISDCNLSDHPDLPRFCHEQEKAVADPMVDVGSGRNQDRHPVQVSS